MSKSKKERLEESGWKSGGAEEFLNLSDADIIEIDRRVFLDTLFNKLISKWKEDIFAISSSTAIYEHPNYLSIIDLGAEAIPLILKEIQQNNTTHLDLALQTLTGEDRIVKKKLYGKLDLINQVWLKWGKEKGYL